MAAAVPTFINTGVSITPCTVVSLARLALPSRFNTSYMIDCTPFRMFYHYKLYFGFRQMKTSLRLQIPALRGKRPVLAEVRAYLGRRMERLRGGKGRTEQRGEKKRSGRDGKAGACGRDGRLRPLAAQAGHPLSALPARPSVHMHLHPPPGKPAPPSKPAGTFRIYRPGEKLLVKNYKGLYNRASMADVYSLYFSTLLR